MLFSVMMRFVQIFSSGSGKFRRHLKFKQLADVKAKQPAAYIKQAIALLAND